MLTQDQAYRAYCTLARDLQAKRWTPADRQALEALYQSVCSLNEQSKGNAAIGDLEKQVRCMRSELHHTHYMSPVKKVFLGLSLAFLSASAARYWINKLEPLVDAYVHTAISAPPPAEEGFEIIDEILHERR